MLPLGSIYFPLIYVLPFYVWPTQLPRNHPTTIWRRMAVSAVTCLALSWVPTYLTLQAAAGPGRNAIPAATVLAAMGFRAPGLPAAAALPLALLAFLFAGPLLYAVRTGTLVRRGLLRTPAGLRNLVAAPLTEELCFRAGLISFLLASGVSPARALWLSPLVFGAAHFHHVYDLVKHQGWAVADAAAAATVQVGYTTVFGWLAAFLLLQTGHFTAVACAHAFCNYMGFPDFGGMFRHPQARVLKAVTLAGVLAFAAALRPATAPTLFGYPAGWAGYPGLFQLTATQ